MSEWKRRHWRVVDQGFSFGAPCALFRVEYRSRFFGRWVAPFYDGFPSNADAVEWINQRQPLSIAESASPPREKPEDWNDRKVAFGRWGTPDQKRAALERLVMKSRT